MKVMKFAIGLAAGYVLGSRAGREKYEQILAGARKAQNHPAVTQVQQKAKELLNAGTDTLTARVDPQPTDTETTVPAGDTVPAPPRRRTRSTITAPSMTADPPV